MAQGSAVPESPHAVVFLADEAEARIESVVVHLRQDHRRRLMRRRGGSLGERLCRDAEPGRAERDEGTGDAEELAAWQGHGGPSGTGGAPAKGRMMAATAATRHALGRVEGRLVTFACRS